MQKRENIMFEVNRKDRMVEIIHGEQRIEYPIEETENLIDFLPYKEEYTKQTFKDKIISFMNRPKILIWGHILWLIGRILIAQIAIFGVYTILNSITNTYSPAQIEEAKTTIYILEHMSIVIQIYVLWDVLSTLIKVYINIMRLKVAYGKD